MNFQEDLKKGNFDYARYHVKELDKSLIDSLRKRFEMLGEGDDGVVEVYNKRLRELIDKFEG